MAKHTTEADIDRLFRCILTLQTPEECRRFFTDLCTEFEVDEMARRLTAASLLLKNAPHPVAVECSGLSSSTVSRVNRTIRYGKDGYRMALERLERQERFGRMERRR